MSRAAIAISSPREWTWLLTGLAAIYGLFQLTAAGLRSERGEAGLAVAALVTIATLAVERAWTGRSVARAALTLGLGLPRARGMTAAAAVCLLLVLVVPVFAWSTGTAARIAPGAGWLLPGLFAQAGLAEELLFRGYELYSPPPEGTWFEIHQLYRYSELLGITDTPLDDPLNGTLRQVGIGHAYKQALLLDFADPYHLPARLLDSARLAVLADALEEAGCSEANVLRHLREPAEHVRGCWAVDLVLARCSPEQSDTP